MRTAATRTALIPAVALLLMALALWLAPSATAAPSDGDGDGNHTLLGNDISWPQCNRALPKDAAFGIVGVNNGLANTTNPCLAEQLEWAEAIGETDQPPSTGQPAIALYVNTANPGLTGSWWPTSNEYPVGRTVANPYGDCAKAAERVGEACSYMYGYAKAYDDAYVRGIASPSDYLWWLDVETGNSWSTDTDWNRAVLEGMTAFFHSIKADVGIYSSGYQWAQLVGEVGSSSNLHPLPSWLAGARTVTGAKARCSDPPLTGGGEVTMTQFVSRGFDYNYSCT